MMCDLFQNAEIVAWVAMAKSNDACEQCTYPWFDGICECEWGPENATERDEIAALAHSLIMQADGP